jgi:hypothetical protein
MLGHERPWSGHLEQPGVETRQGQFQNGGRPDARPKSQHKVEDSGRVLEATPQKSSATSSRDHATFNVLDHTT